MSYGGALKSPPCPHDNIFENLARGHPHEDLPAEYDLRTNRKVLPPRDQGSRGTCAAFAGAAMREMQLYVNSEPVRLSPEFIYFHRENRPGKGMHGRDVFIILRDIGTVPESDYPYLTDDPITKPSRKLRELALEYRIHNFARITTAKGLKRALYEIGPCYMQLPLYETRPLFWKRAENEEEASLGHAMVVVGYNAEGFILQNSWGEDWHDFGCIVFPYSEWETVVECWVGVDRMYYEDDHRVAADTSGFFENVAHSLREYTEDKKCNIL